MSIFDVQYQPRAHRVVQRALAGRRMPHAYLFTGPEGVGRELMAIRLTQVLLCVSPVRGATGDAGATGGHAGIEMPDLGDLVPTDACGRCDDCHMVKAGTHPDLYLVYRQLNREHPDSQIRKQKALTLSVDIIRHFLIDPVARRPLRGRAKVFIVREAERLSDAAQNSLLKTLEEPPPDTFLILLTSATDRMLPTTKSRCQPVSFQPLPASFVAERLGSLRESTPQPERLFAARQSGGSLGVALRSIDDGLFELKRNWGRRVTEWVRPVRGFGPHSLGRPFLADATAIGKLASDRDPDMSDTDAARLGIQGLLAMIASFYQDAQRQVTGSAVEPINADQPEVIAALTATHSSRQLVAAMRQIAQADAAIGRNAALELTMETLFIHLAGVAQGRPGSRIAIV